MGPALELRGITKSFGALRANEDVSLAVDAGEVFALVGENGAGKTTLMNVVYGLYHPDAGEVWVRGQRARIRGPADAIALGIGMVHQHFMLVGPLTVAENVVLGKEPRRGGLFDRARAEREVGEVAERFGFALDPAARVETLTVAEQQRVEIVKTLWRGAEILILDEPTAVLSPTQAEDLYRVVGGLAGAGKTVVFISHKLREVLAAARRVGVMRRGRLVATVEARGTEPDRLAELMVGSPPGLFLPELRSPTAMRDSAESKSAGASRPSHGRGAEGASTAASQPAREGALPAQGEPRSPPSPAPAAATPHPAGGPSTTGVRHHAPAPPLLSVFDVDADGDRGKRALHDITFELRAGEILAVAGVDGNGQTELAEVLTGLRAIHSGEIKIAGREVTGLPPRGLRDAGVGHVPEDRHRRGLCLEMTVAENLALGRHDRPPFARGAWIDFPGRAAAAARLIAHYDVRPPDAEARARSLSGGNQQKVILAREIDAGPKVLVAVQPTRGLDVNAVSLVHSRLRAHRAGGGGVLLFSLDLDEVLALADRILVLYGGRIMGEVPCAEASEAVLGRLMLGGKLQPQAEARHG